jgi:hypothetical protein
MRQACALTAGGKRPASTCRWDGGMTSTRSNSRLRGDRLVRRVTRTAAVAAAVGTAAIAGALGLHAKPTAPATSVAVRTLAPAGAAATTTTTTTTQSAPTVSSSSQAPVAQSGGS